MQYKRTFLKGVAVLVAVAACSDGAVAPVVPSHGVPLPLIGPGRRPDGDEQVTVTRTIEVQPPAGPGQDAPSPVRRTKTFTFGAAMVTASQDSAAITGALKARSRSKVTSVDDLPVIGLTEPVRAGSFRGAIVPWRRAINLPDDLATMIESFGTGDAPASEIRYTRNGALTMTVRQEWELWQRRWNLVRRETTIPDGSFTEVVTITRTGRTGSALQAPAQWAQGLRHAGAVTPSFDMYGDDGATCAACQGFVNAAQDALEIALLTGVGTAIACTISPSPACIAAWFAYSTVLVKLNRANSDRDDCLADKIKCPPPRPVREECLIRSTGKQLFLPTPTCSGTNGGAGGSGGGGGSDSTGSKVCTYYYEYDLETGEVLYAELLYCRWVAGN